MSLSTLNVNASGVVQFFKEMVPPAAWAYIYKKLVIKDIADANMYAPHFSPWLGAEFQRNYAQIKGHTGLRPQSIYTLLHFLDQTAHLKGDIAECGVWRGGSARLLAQAIAKNQIKRSLYLFDSFAGMAEVSNSHDRHKVGDFSDTSLGSVRSFVLESGVDSDRVHFRKGWIPDSFAGLESATFSFVHIDLDLYKSIKDALQFFYPRLVGGGAIVFDDYGYASCPGARHAVDEFFFEKSEKPFPLSTGQAIAIKSGGL